jgi:hypothetical protein
VGKPPGRKQSITNERDGVVSGRVVGTDRSGAVVTQRLTAHAHSQAGDRDSSSPKACRQK